MHDSITPLGGLVPLANIQLGEIVFGGVGAGFYGLLIYVLLSVFIAGLMVGRTPEYLGKKMESYDVKIAMLYVLIFPLIILGLAAVSRAAAAGTGNSEQQRAARTLRDSLRVYFGNGSNLGSAFACGWGSANCWYHLTMGFTMCPPAAS